MQKVPYKEVTLAKVSMLIDTTKPLAFDSETIGLYGKIRLGQFYQEHWDEVLLVNRPNPFELANLLDKAHVIMHNNHYDVSCIQYATDTRWCPKKQDDTFYLARLKFFLRDKFALDDVMTYVLKYDPYEEQGLDKKVLQKSDWSVMVLSNDQKLYAATDVFYLLDVYNEVKSCEDDTSYKLDMLSLKYALDFQNNGMAVLGEELNSQYADNVAILDKLNMPINVNSWQQVRPYINEDDSDALALATFSLGGNERAANVNKARKTIKQNSFIDKFAAFERIMGLFKPGARSGRFTSNNQNLQQIPRKLKHCFGYLPEDGRCITYADYAQLEMRTIAAITGDLRMAGVLRAGEDLHDFTAKMLFGESFTPEQRQIAKTCNFNLLYGGGAGMLRSILITQANLLISLVEAQAAKAKWHNLYATVTSWQQSGINAYHHGTPWQTPFGRKYKGKLMTDQLNIQNQGAGAEVAKLAMHYMYEEYQDVFVPQDVELVNFIHDAFVFENPDDEAVYKPLADLVAKSMQTAWFEFLRSGKNLKIRDLPMPVDVFVGYNWGRIEKDPIYKLELEGMRYAA